MWSQQGLNLPLPTISHRTTNTVSQCGCMSCSCNNFCPFFVCVHVYHGTWCCSFICVHSHASPWYFLLIHLYSFVSSSLSEATQLSQSLWYYLFTVHRLCFLINYSSGLTQRAIWLSDCLRTRSTVLARSHFVFRFTYHFLLSHLYGFVPSIHSSVWYSLFTGHRLCFLIKYSSSQSLYLFVTMEKATRLD